MKILITNDDGVDADGLRALAVVLRQEHEVWVVAPSGECSNCGHCVTVKRPLVCAQFEPNVWSVDGWPADCIRVADKHLGLTFDWVVAGINHGGNLGVDIPMSGTCAAAREAAIHRMSAVAISQVRKRDVAMDWQVSARRAARLLAEIWSDSAKSGGFWNINLPAIAPEETMRESRMCRPELAPLPLKYELDNNGLVYHSDYHARTYDVESDVYYCFRGHPTKSFVGLIG